MRLPFVSRQHAINLTRSLEKCLVELNLVLAASGALRRRVASLERENAELRRQLEERLTEGEWWERFGENVGRQIKERDAGRPEW